MARQERITVFIDEEMKKYLKSRQLSMSRWVRTAIKEKRYRMNKALEYEKLRYMNNANWGRKFSQWHDAKKLQRLRKKLNDPKAILPSKKLHS